jgi:hypothetical protein
MANDDNERVFRILQIMPADGWILEDTSTRQRITGFCLVEEWYSNTLDDSQPPSGAKSRRHVLPLSEGWEERLQEIQSWAAKVN